MTTRVLSFGSYSFDDAVVEFQDNFLNLVPRTSRLPGLSGGFAEDGWGAAAQDIGHVTYHHVVTADSPSAMRVKLDAIRALSGKGIQRLTIEPARGEPSRWCWAAINDIQYSMNVSNSPNLQMPVQIDWQVPDPRWYSTGTEGPFWGEFAWGDGSKWGGATAPYSLSGLSNTLTITTLGNAPTLPKISVMTYAAQAVNSFSIYRIVNGQVIDGLIYSGVLGANETVVIDCRALAVRHQTLPAYSLLTALRPQWFELQPGANTVVVLFGNSGDAAKVRFGYFDAYY